jgi:hypothetical protein
MRKIHIFLGAAALSLGVSAGFGSSTEVQTGGTYFDALRDSITEVIAEHQDLINRASGDEVKSKDLEAKAFYKATYSTFKKIAGAGFSPKKFRDETDPEKISHVLAALLQAGRVTIAKAQGTINTESDGTVQLKKFIPAVFGRLVADRFREKTGASLKQTTLGKGDWGARNSYNAPDDWESGVLQRFASDGWVLNEGVGEEQGGSYRYMKPIYIKQACMPCHGETKGEEDPYGQTKEGYEVGDVRGGISVMLPR